MDITITLSDEQVRDIKRAFRRGRFDEIEETVKQLSQLAVASWVDWLSGEERYTSLTDQYTNWLESVYTHLLPEDEPPSTERLYNSFNIPYGRAQYIARVLSSKTLTHWRQRAVEQLKSAMEKRFDDVDELLEEGRADNVEIRIGKLSFLELKSTWERLFQSDPDEIVPPEYDSAGDVYLVRISAICFRKIYEAIEI